MRNPFAKTRKRSTDPDQDQPRKSHWVGDTVQVNFKGKVLSDLGATLVIQTPHGIVVVPTSAVAIVASSSSKAKDTFSKDTFADNYADAVLVTGYNGEEIDADDLDWLRNSRTRKR